jgi:hypothetical protein
MPARQPAAPSEIYQLKVTLRYSKPPIWRRILERGDTTLARLHDILQVAMGWTDSHLHQFVVGTTSYGPVDPYNELDVENERSVRLSEVAPQAKARFTYEYDFGDGWLHQIVVERVRPAEEGTRYPVCVAGKRACPPEDCGGIWGYESFLESIRDPTHPEHADMLAWAGGSFDPEAFDLEDVNRQLRHMQ